MSSASKRSMRRIGSILLGGLLGLVAAVALLVFAIILSEYAISRGWVSRYNDREMAYIVQGILVAAPIIGGWWAWVRGY